MNKMTANGYSQAIKTIKNAINRQLLAGEFTEEQNSTVSKMEIVQNEGWNLVTTHKKYLLVQIKGKRQIGHYGTGRCG
jgi:beta-galactosidase beta subunit